MDDQGQWGPRMDRLEQRMDEQFSHLMHAIEQLVHMVAENNRGLAELRSEMAEFRHDTAALRNEMTTRMGSLEERIKVSTAVWQAESRHFAHTLGELQRDVAVLKER